ncbi:probable gluconokinase isoform X2 [Hemiscyllium ocellatum]|uniref:probable gluconokinase isoform X2 n=1 Tax=Hemiscyllium ocellatum TaxID=170820 RepID=UPI0029675E91|nr:probable gluconokinase isoform X2 [Hemiscyllium ocellatum]
MILILMGVSGSGKTAVGSCLANKLGWKFYDADDYHPKENKEKMVNGIPLDDEDRIPWLCTLHEILMREISFGENMILACSSLKRMYRRILTESLQCESRPSEDYPTQSPCHIYHG